MEALILGATGLVGQSIWRDWKSRSWDVAGTYFKHPVPGLDPLDMQDAAAVDSYIRRTKPKVVVITSANPFVDYCETHKEETRKLNVDSTVKVAEIARENAAKVIFFSTEYVFPGQKEPYDEQSEAKPLSEYGAQKVAVEKWMKSNLKNSLILRISGVYGWALPFNRKNFVMQILNCSANHTTISAATDVSYDPTYAPNLGPVLAELLEKNENGIFHAAGEKALSRYEFAMEIVDVFGLDRSIVRPVTFEALSSGPLAKRPQYAALNTDKLRKTVQARLWAPRQALEHMKLTEKEWSA